MNVQFKAHHLPGLSTVEAHVREKTNRFSHLLPETAYLEFEFKQFAKAPSHGNGDKEVEVLVDIPGQPVIRFACQGSTFMEAADCVLDKLDEELSRTKSKRRDHGLHHKAPLKERVADMVNKDEY